MKYDYWYGPDDTDRRVKYRQSFRPEYQANGDDIDRRIGAVVTAFKSETGIELPYGYSSGWRPDAVNELTANAGKHSTHLTANAGDKRDNADGAFCWWCYRNENALVQHALWMEHPVATLIRAWVRAIKEAREPTPWCHLQSVPPGSHRRIYMPDGTATPEWSEFLRRGGYAGITFAEFQRLPAPKT